MDFKDAIKQITERIEKLKTTLQTEEATKNALIMPFLNVLGYDVFNPLEVVPEMTCDVGTKQGEKIDYAIMKDGEPIILIECKHWEQNLDKHGNQLLRYFGVSKAKFGILTNGIEYRFYSDLDTPNVMDASPFLIVNLADPKDNQIEELKKFHKSYFNIDTILGTANELKYSNELRKVIHNEFTNPSFDFVRYLGKQVYTGLFNSKVAEQFTPLVKRVIANYINDMINDRLKSAMEPEEAGDQTAAPAAEPEASRIFTSEEELQAFYIIRSILGEVCPVDEIMYKDSISRFTIFHKSNQRKTICRFESSDNTTGKFVICPQDGEPKYYRLENQNDIYTHAEELRAVLRSILNK